MNELRITRFFLNRRIVNPYKPTNPGNDGAGRAVPGSPSCRGRIMKSTLQSLITRIPRHCFTTLTALLLVSGCVSNDNASSRRRPGPAPYAPPNPNVAKEFHEEPAGSRFRYLDNHGRYTVDLYAGGACRIVSVSQNEMQTDEREGRWAWKSTGEKQGVLTLNGIRWDLYFASPTLSTAQTEGDVRTYRFEWERLSSAQKPAAAPRY